MYSNFDKHWIVTLAQIITMLRFFKLVWVLKNRNKVIYRHDDSFTFTIRCFSYYVLTFFVMCLYFFFLPNHISGLRITKCHKSNTGDFIDRSCSLKRSWNWGYDQNWSQKDHRENNWRWAGCFLYFCQLSWSNTVLWSLLEEKINIDYLPQLGTWACEL